MADQRAPASEIFGWAMFDFANSAYTTVIVTVVYAQVFPRLIVGDASRGNLLWSVALATSYAIVTLAAPALGALADATAQKKRFLAVSWLFTVVCTAALGLAGPGDVWLAFGLIVLSNLGFSAGESFTSAFLPDLGTPEDLGKISGFAWGLGYFGGLVATAAVLFGFGPFDEARVDAVKWIGPVTAAFFFVGALPTFALLRERGTPRPLGAGGSAVAEAFRSLRVTAASLRGYRDLVAFFGSLFFSQAGLSIVIAFAFIYGDQVIHWSQGTMTLMFVVTQITAAMGAVAFGALQDRIGARVSYAVTLVLWIVAVALIRLTPEVSAALGVAPQTFFLFVGGLAGSGLGATQSAGRTIVGLFTPAAQAGEMFGFWGLVGKLASIVGLLGVGALQTVFGLQDAILVCVVFFAAALGVSFVVDEQRGRARAREAASTLPDAGGAHAPA
jgi:UMF1 family MFS transporter